jgi:quinoprotein glucose dehydrogenase
MNTSSRSGPLVAITGSVFILLGLALLLGGIYLAKLGGSAYYLASGIGLIVAGVLVCKRRRSALGLMAAILIATVIWSIVEVCFDWWQLLPRLDIWFAAAVWLLLPFVDRRLAKPEQGPDTGRKALFVAVAITVVVGVIALFHDYHDIHGEVAQENMAGSGTHDAAGVAENDWSAYGRSGHGDRYAPAAQITPANISELTQAWSYHTGDLKGPTDPGEIANEVTPIKVNGMLYMCTPHNIVIALDPDSGKEIWRHDPQINRDAAHYQHMICRGVSYWDANARSLNGAPAHADAATMECPRRIIAPTMDGTLIAVNADTGESCKSFGQNGVIDLYKGHPVKTRGMLMPTSPPAVAQNMIVMAASVTDNHSTNEPSGVIRGYDPVSGKLVWNWDPARPDETSPLTEGDTYVRNSPNSWGVSSIDEKLGMVYIPMGNETPDTWGGRRNKNGERFNSAIVALDIATGKLRWVYQTVHHDIWDMDIGGQPTLVDIDTPKGKVPSVVATTKTGHIFVIDRRDGSLVVPAPETPVPTSNVAEGDWVSPTQPYSALSFLPERNISEADMWGATPFDQLACRIIFKNHRYEGPFTPQTVGEEGKGAIISPGPLGIFEWGGATVDPVRQLLIVNPDYMGFLERLVPQEKANAKGGNGGEMGLQPQTGVPFAVEISPFLSPLGFPCQAPPWGYVAAVDLKTMKKVWMHKNGTTRDSAPVPISLPLGVPSLGGMMTTGGGVTFLSSTLDYFIRGYDVSNGKEIWKARLPAGGQATPMSYVSDKTGKQYVVVMAGGHGSLGTNMGDQVVAYALPDGVAAAAAKPAKAR